MTVVAIHQPNFLPHCGFWLKAFASDVFILLDTAQYPRESYVNRVKSLLLSSETAAGALRGDDGRWYAADWLTIPVPKGLPLATAIRDVPIGQRPGWQRKLIGRIHDTYHRCEAFPVVSPLIRSAIESAAGSLASLNLRLIHGVGGLLGCPTKFVVASTMSASSGAGHVADTLAALCAEAGASEYLSGPSGRKYLDEGGFRAKGISVRYAEWPQPEWTQPVSPFVPGLSVLDLLMRTGPAGAQRALLNSVGRG